MQDNAINSTSSPRRHAQAGASSTPTGTTHSDIARPASLTGSTTSATEADDEKRPTSVHNTCKQPSGREQNDMDLEKGQAGAHNSSAAGGPLTSSDDTEDDDNDDDDNHGAPDLAHQRIEDMVPGHSLDRELSRTRDVESIRTIETRHTVRSKVSRVFSRQSRKSNAGDGLKHARIPETDLDAGVVGWDSQDDPAMPLNFPPAKKWLLVALLSAITFVTPFASSILSPGIANLLQDFGESSSIVGAMTVSIYLLGYVVGPMFLAPMSEIYGRRPILGLANISFCCWQIGCALSPNIVALIIFRFLSGVGGSGCLTLGGGLIADIFRPEQRGFAMGMWLIGPIIGPTVGPLIGGFVAETIGWRWDFWLVLMIAVPITALIEIFNQETSYYILVKNKTARLCKQVGRDDLRSCYDTMTNLPGNKKASRGRILFNGLVRPLKMLFLSPIVLLLTLYMSFVYGALYLLFTTIPTVFEDTYGFNTGLTGLVYLGIGTGTTLGWVILTLYSDKTVIYLAKKNNGEFVPEMRLWMAIWFSWLMPITFFWYGWCAEYKVQWMSPILSFIPFGTGLMGLFMPINTYLVDCYPMYAASALAANTELRSLVGALLPLAGTPMYNALGLGWGNSLLGFLCILMIPLPIVFNRYGQKLREMEKFKL